MNRLKKQDIEIETPDGKIKLDYAIGYEIFDPSSSESLDEVLKISDKKMYENKRLYKIGR